MFLFLVFLVFFVFVFFGIFGFVFLVFLVLVCLVFLVLAFLAVLRGKGLLCFRVLITAAPLSVRVDSDVVEEACLNCPKRSGRV